MSCQENSGCWWLTSRFNDCVLCSRSGCAHEFMRDNLVVDGGNDILSSSLHFSGLQDCVCIGITASAFTGVISDINKTSQDSDTAYYFLTHTRYGKVCVARQLCANPRLLPATTPWRTMPACRCNECPWDVNPQARHQEQDGESKSDSWSAEKHNGRHHVSRFADVRVVQTLMISVAPNHRSLPGGPQWGVRALCNKQSMFWVGGWQACMRKPNALTLAHNAGRG